MNAKVRRLLSRGAVVACMASAALVSGSFAAAVRPAGGLGTGTVVRGPGNVVGVPKPSELPNAYLVTVLAADSPGVGLHVDSKLVNPWGLAHAGGGPWMVANNGTAAATLLSGDGTPQSLVINVPGAPTGVVFNTSPKLVIQKEAISGSPVFLFASEDGTISGWNPLVSMTEAFVVVDNSSAHAIYKGIAMARTIAGDRIYATDFHNGRVDVFDGAFKPVSISGAFEDPDLPAGFAPFGIANIGGRMFVTYAQQDGGQEDDVPGPGLGYVDAFSPSGKFLLRVASAGSLNAPWGLARAPLNFGKFGGALLVGDFGDGRITAFGLTDDLLHTEELGQLADADGNPISIEGLWGISFGNEGQAGPSNALYFTAGPNDEKDGLFGNIRPAE